MTPRHTSLDTRSTCKQLASGHRAFVLKRVVNRNTTFEYERRQYHSTATSHDSNVAVVCHAFPMHANKGNAQRRRTQHCRELRPGWA